MSVKFFSKKTAVIAGLAGGTLLACAGLVWYFFFSGFPAERQRNAGFPTGTNRRAGKFLHGRG